MNKSENTSWTPLILVAAAAFVSALDATFMNVSISQLVIDLDTDVATIQKIVSFYTLITASMMLISSKLQDIIGKRTIFLLGSIIYGVGSLVAAISPNATILFLGWALIEGIGGAMMSPAVISIISGTYDSSRRTTALAVVSAIAGIAAAIGPIFGGVCTTYFSWRYGFAFELIVIVIVVIAYRKIPYFARTTSPKDLDITGSILSVAGLLLLILGILQLSDSNMQLCLILIIASIIVLLAFGMFEIRRSKAGKVPLFDVTLLKDRNLTIGTLLRMIAALAMAGTLFAVSIYLQSVLKMSAIETGLMLIPMTAGMMLVSLVAPKLATKIGHKYSMILGFAVAIAGCLILRQQFNTDLTFLSLFPGMFIFGVGLGFPQSLSVDAALSTIPPQAQNSGSGFVSTGQNLGMSMGTAIIGLVIILGAVGGLQDAINTYTPLQLDDEAFKANAEYYLQKMGHVDALTVTVKDMDTYQLIINAVYEDAMKMVMMVTAGLMALGGILTLALKNVKKK